MNENLNFRYNLRIYKLENNGRNLFKLKPWWDLLSNYHEQR